MSTANATLPLIRTATPADQAELAAEVRAAFEAETAIYPIGGRSSLDYGLPARTPGLGLVLTKLNRVIDYPARDMTITIEAGIRMADLAQTLASEGQRLPVDAAQFDVATLGGLIATNSSGPRRYGQGTIRDYVIGISAIDGRGQPFKGGGRVVKNVAGYDFCKLLTGSLGTLGVISQVTLKVKPTAPASALLVCDFDSLDQAELLLAALVNSRTTPTAIELLVGPAWKDLTTGSPAGNGSGKLLVGLEGTAVEVDWMLQTLEAEWRAQGVSQSNRIPSDEVAGVWTQLTDFPASGDSPLTLRINVLPGRTTNLVQRLLEIDPNCSIQAHAGNGIINARFQDFPAGGMSRILIGKLQPTAQQAGGQVVVVSARGSTELTRQAVWGSGGESLPLMNSVKQQFDPKGLLNPGRFVY